MKFYYYILAFVSLILLAHDNLCASSPPFLEYLEWTERRFNAALTQEEQYNIVSQPANLDYLESLNSFQEFDEKKAILNEGNSPYLYVNQENKYCPHTTPIALSISLGSVDFTKKFIAVVGDVNNHTLATWGYRQPYTLAHLALDPQYPKAKNDIPLETRLAIIDVLGEKKANFNQIILCNDYQNPPLAAGDPSGRPFNDYKKFRARALLYGADPTIVGSSFWPLKLEREDYLLKYTLEYYIERRWAGAILTPTDLVMAHLKRVAVEKGVSLEKLEDMVGKKVTAVKIIREQLCQEEAKAQKTKKEIDSLKSQQTKKARRKVSHLQAIQNEQQEYINKLNRTLKKQFNKKLHIKQLQKKSNF